MTRKIMDYNCPGCGFSGACHDRVVHGYDIYICTGCGLAFTWPRPTEEEVTAFYHSLDLASDLYGGQSPVKRAFFSLCHREIEKYCSSGRLLDFGCGDCCFLNEARSGVFELFGADLHSGIEKIEHKRKIGFFIGPLHEQGVKDEFFDVIFTSATYEHFLDPGAITREFHRILKPGGLLFIVSVPSYDSINIKLGIEDWLINRPPAHINFFRRPSIRQHLGLHGFQVLKSWTYGFNLEPVKRRLKGVKADTSLKELVESPADRVSRSPRDVTFLHRMIANIYFKFPCFGLGDKLAVMAVKR